MSDRLPQKRVRVSAKTIDVVLEALEKRGLSVDKLLIQAGQVEVHVQPVEGREAPAKDGGLTDW